MGLLDFLGGVFLAYLTLPKVYRKDGGAAGVGVLLLRASFVFHGFLLFFDDR